MIFLGESYGLRAFAGKFLHLTSLSCPPSLGLLLAQDCYVFL